jgi:pilus assembly protein TadC
MKNEKISNQSKVNVKKNRKKAEFKVPFSFSSVDKLKKRSEFFKKYLGYKKNSNLGYCLENADTGLTREDYLSICLRGVLISFFAVLIVSSTLLIFLKIERALIISLGLAILFSGFIFFSRINYPKVYVARKQKNIEKNLIPALEDMLVQLNSGVPLFDILVNISSSDYSSLSQEFEKAVRKINAGIPEIEVLDELGKRNNSLFFRRALWQISNGMRAGSDTSIVIESTVKSLNEEQLIQIQNYGNKLNPAIMFYMLSSVILPALAVTFLTIISSLINLPKTITQGLFIAFFVLIMVVQFSFLGVIKSIRPSLL